MRAPLAAGLAVGLLLTGCSAPDPGSSPGRSPAPPVTASPSRADSSPSATARATAPSPGRADGATSPPPVHPVSLPALFDKEYDGRRLRLGELVARTDAYEQRNATFRGDGLTISGQMLVPHGRGPFPVVVLAHGYIDPAVYASGQGLRREQDWLARAGYAVLHVDYRNHAASDRDPGAEVRLRLGYTVDVVNAVHAVRRSRDRRLDGDRVALLGRSMGGGVVYNVLAVAPGLVDAAVVFAPVSSSAADNFDRWVRHDPARAEVSRRILHRYGAPEDSRRFWRHVSPRTYFGRFTEPLLIHHGTADDVCPLRWSRATMRALERADVDARLVTYPGEPHAFLGRWPDSMRRSVRFLDRHLDGHLDRHLDGHLDGHLDRHLDRAS